MIDPLNGLYLKERKKIFLESSDPQKLSYWYIWKVQIEKRTQRNVMASLRNSLNKMKQQKLNLEQN